VDVLPNQALRAELERLSLDELVGRLERVDPGALERVDRLNPRRLVRAIEVAEAGYLSSMTRVNIPRYDCYQLGVTWTREVLVQRIERRLRERLEGGMIEEVSRLREGGVSDQRLEQLGLEYRYLSRYLRGELVSVGELSEQLGVAIRHYAREQMKWFKRDSKIHWLGLSGDYFGEACELLGEWGLRGGVS
jgi:tRNA dimethylallyltransferase